VAAYARHMSARRVAAVAAALAALVLAAPAPADDWDSATDDDDDPAADNSLRHGSYEEHDLAAVSGVADQDWYRLAPFGLTSWELTIEATGDLDLASTDVQRLDQTGATVLQTAAVSSDVALLQYENTEPDLIQQRVRVQGAACGTACTDTDSYQIGLVNTTYGIPRFSNKGSRVTLVAMSSLRGVSTGCAGVNVHFVDAGGIGKGPLATETVDLGNGKSVVLDTSKIAGVENAKGSIIVTHTCGYGVLTGQGIQLEPAKGFSYATPMVPVAVP